MFGHSVMQLMVSYQSLKIYWEWFMYSSEEQFHLSLTGGLFLCLFVVKQLGQHTKK